MESNIYIDISQKENLKPLNLIDIGTSQKENLKPLNLIDIGTKGKLMFTNSIFFPDEKQTKFRKDWLKFYVAAVQHLQSNLHLDIPFVKHAQFLHPEKRQLPGTASAISNLALSICFVHKKLASKMFSLLNHQ